ncbi:SPW repeat protein [Conexibacter sp. SYSU D00693]|uniref:SPW repeat protein n=1 Tax=Conexibacter sp. SYSU D00693 TaxID=2812560 RepID=UPI00196B5558|nr:SPW repeat protein [Conexibacter sp. SYSU D00693]
MTAFRLIPLPVHGALELLMGLFTMAAPFLFGFEAPATVIAVLVGAMTVGLALAAASAEPAGARGTLPVATHHAFDYGLTVGLLGAAIVVGLDGDANAALTMTLLALVQLSLNLTTRYSLRA